VTLAIMSKNAGLHCCYVFDMRADASLVLYNVRRGCQTGIFRTVCGYLLDNPLHIFRPTSEPYTLVPSYVVQH